MIKLFDCSISKESRVGIDQIFNEGNLTSGNFTSEVEAKLGQIYQSDCITFSDMTTALVQLMKSLEIQSGDVVLCHPYCCLSTTMAIKLAGANVEWIKFDHDNLCLDINSLRSKIMQAKIVLNYNVAGFLPDLQLLEELCQENSVILINDCNNSELSRQRGEFSVQYGDYSVMSFYPNRTFGAIDGAAILSNKFSLNGLKKYQRLGILAEEYRHANGLFNQEHDVDIIAGSNNISNISAKLVLNKLDNFSETMVEKLQTFHDILYYFKEITLASPPLDEIVPWMIPVFAKNTVSFYEKTSRLGIETTELHLNNSKYSVFGKSSQLISPLGIIWLPFNKKIIKYSEEIIRYAS